MLTFSFLEMCLSLSRTHYLFNLSNVLMYVYIPSMHAVLYFCTCDFGSLLLFNSSLSVILQTKTWSAVVQAPKSDDTCKRRTRFRQVHAHRMSYFQNHMLHTIAVILMY